MNQLLSQQLRVVKAVIFHGADYKRALENGRFRFIIYANTLKNYEVRIIKTWVSIAVITKREGEREPLKLTTEEIDKISADYFKKNIESYFKVISYDEVYQILTVEKNHKLLEVLQSELGLVFDV